MASPLTDELLGAIAREEIEVSRQGGPRWTIFVRRAEEVTGVSWDRLRVLIDPYVEAELRLRAAGEGDT